MSSASLLLRCPSFFAILDSSGGRPRIPLNYRVFGVFALFRLAGGRLLGGFFSVRFRRGGRWGGG